MKDKLNLHTRKDSRGSGVRVRIRNTDTNLSYAYYHMQGGSNDHLNIGDQVNQGDQIGTVGQSAEGQLVNTTRLSGPHLHFEIWSNGSKINPYLAFPELALVPFTKHRNN
jgi:murein DD-endopeptidase MepM/ murein hydrolase activator NlpD